MNSFSNLNISPEMIENLKSLKYNYMTQIQEQTIPVIIKGKDLLAQAKTGSGKTAAFGIGLLELLEVENFRIQSIIVCPTRELAEQVTKEIRKLAKFKHNIKVVKLIGGFPMYKQEHSLKHKAHIVVGTPGRVLKLLERGSLSFKHLKNIVLDEADRMLDMGFIDQIDEIIKYTPVESNIFCFSATFTDEIKELSKSILNNPKEIVVETKHDLKIIEQYFYRTEKKGKIELLINTLYRYKPESVIVFCNTKDVCRRVNKALTEIGIESLALHGDLEQKERTETLVMFSNGSSRILVSTDVAARGLDIADLGAVINYDLPFETETYIHRIGRTGRAGNKGLSVSLLSDGEEFRLDDINKYQKTNIEAENNPNNNDLTRTYLKPGMSTLSINGGRRNKISPGDILGALTSNGVITGNDVGKIDRLDYITYIAVKSEKLETAYTILEKKGVKGKFFKLIKHNLV